MSTEQNKAMVQLIWNDVFNKGDVNKIDELYSPDFIYHGPGGYEIKGTEQLKRFVIWLRTLFNNVNFTIEDLIAEGDEVVSVWTMKATTKNNKQITNKGIIVSRIAENKVVEDLEFWDRMTMAEQAAPNWFAKRMVNAITRQMEKGLP